METFKIGQEIVMTQDFEIEGFSGNKTLVKKDDEGYIDSMGNCHYQTGAARGKIQAIKEDVDIEGYDCENIAKIIYKRLQSQFDIKEFLEGYEIPVEDFINEIEDILSDIL